LESRFGIERNSSNAATGEITMDIVHRVGMKAPVSAVYAALSTVDGLAGWWTRATTGNGSKVGGDVAFRFHKKDGEEIGGFDMKVTELVPDRKVRWRVTAGPAEWVDTDIEFTLSQQNEYTVVLFAHRRWREEVEFTAHCSTKWATFLLSLRDLAETGKGSPAPDDLQVSDWH
jgi:uncharacterized protein YndB with AHSA1/START domain